MHGYCCQLTSDPWSLYVRSSRVPTFAPLMKREQVERDVGNQPRVPKWRLQYFTERLPVGVFKGSLGGGNLSATRNVSQVGNKTSCCPVCVCVCVNAITHTHRCTHAHDQITDLFIKSRICPVHQDTSGTAGCHLSHERHVR